ncbi:MAG: CDP-alcohol phosphatidyltransferase family protein [Notoacmeibacter sp.]
MFDGALRKAINPAIDQLAGKLAKSGISANAVTIAGFGLALSAFAAIVFGWLLIGLGLIFLSRLCDALDGAVAKQNKPTDFGGYLDIVLDFAFYGLIPLAFALYDPTQNALAAGVLLLSFYVNGASFLAFAIIAEKRKLTTNARGKKSFFFTTGLAEAGETLAVFVVFCILPNWFAPVAFVFAAICFWTAFARVLEAKVVFKD